MSYFVKGSKMEYRPEYKLALYTVRQSQVKVNEK